MIVAADSRRAPAGVASAGRALAARFGGGALDLPEAETAAPWSERLMASLPAAEACAVLEHLFGVLPLVAAYWAPEGELAEVAAGRKLAALGLFTPTPELRWCAAALAAERSGDGLRLEGEVRLPNSAADGSLVPVRLPDGEHRLAWLEHGAPGVERRGDAPCRLAVQGATVGPAALSRPVSLDPGAGFHRQLTAYARVWALAAALGAGAGVRALRRAARITERGGRAWRTSQLVAMEITAVEIEAELTVAAVRRELALAADDPASTGGLALAAAAARSLAAVVTLAVELDDWAGLVPDGCRIEDLRRIQTSLGGPRMLESELGFSLGIPDLPPQEASA